MSDDCVKQNVPDFELTLRLRNNQLKRRRTELGLSTYEIAERIGISYVSYMRLEGMQTSPIGRRGKWRRVALAIAKFHGSSCDELWPPSIISVLKPEIVTEIDAARMLAATTPQALPSPEMVIERAELERAIALVKERLTGKEKKVLNMRFGLDDNDEHTLDEIGRLLKVRRERVRQIEAQALSKLRRPSAAKHLRPFANRPNED